jgi:hypothetical protein
MDDRNPYAGAEPAAEADRLVVPVDRRLLIVVACFEVGTLAMVTALLLAKGGPIWALGVVYASILASVLLIASMKTVVRFDERALRLSFPPIYWKSIPWDDIADAEPVTAQAMRDAGGWGPKWRRGSTWLIARDGPAVRITRASGRRPIVFSVPDGEAAAIRILERAVGGTTA